MDIATIAALGYFVANFVQITKFLIDYIASPTSVQNTSLKRLYVVVVAALAVTAHAWLIYHLNTRTDLASIAADTLSVTVAAITGYHVLTTDAMPVTLLPATVVSSPAPKDPTPFAKVILPPDPVVEAKADEAH